MSQSFLSAVFNDMEMYKYSGAGNLFVLIDARAGDMSAYRDSVTISDLCLRNGTDGLILLSDSDSCDFRMEFFNPDGSHGMMCGNGGRCIAAFAADLGIAPERFYRFEAPDGVHTAVVSESRQGVRMVRLSMTAPSVPRKVLDGWFIDTGARHFVKFVDNVEKVNVAVEGAALRFSQEFAPEGVNVDFVERLDDGSIKVRTFEKGVERETLACGTGITASAIVSQMLPASENVSTCNQDSKPFSITVYARIAELRVELTGDGLFLTGPTESLGLCR